MKDHRDFERYFRHPASDILREGVTADACVNLRLALDRLGFPSGDFSSPKFDQKLADALRKFQIAYKTRSADGQCGPGTRPKLVEALLAEGAEFAFERMHDPERRRSGKAFISYARDDLGKVEPFIQLMRSWGYNIWYDSAISSGSVWSDTLREKIDEAFLVIAFLTPYSISREWVQKEIAHADQARKPILPIVLEYLPTAHPLSGILPKYQTFSSHPVSFADLDERLLDKLADALRDAHAKRPSDPPPPPPISSR
jgi:hypothetical protein